MMRARRVMLGVVLSVAAGASTIGCATAPTSAARTPGPAGAGLVAAICQNVMGLSASERLRGGNWLGNDKLDYWTSHYRGCLGSLSDSLQGARDSEVVRQAEEACRAKGLLPGTPDLALCVLQTANDSPQPIASRSTPATRTAGGEVTTGSYYFASPREIARREQLACAVLGLSPAQPEFRSCVQQLNETFYSIDHPIS